MIAKLALRTLWRNRKRYRLVFLAVLVGFALVCLILGVSGGVLKSIKEKAARYFAGQITIRGYVNDSPAIENPDELVNYLAASSLPVRNISKRTIYYHSNAAIYYGGESIRQRRLIGVDFEKERSEFDSLRLIEGSLDHMLAGDRKQSILISKSASKLLGAHAGDAVLLYLTTHDGSANTTMLTVKGVFEENSLFGYVAYMDNEGLNELLALPQGSATDIALYFPSGYSENDAIKPLFKYLGTRYPVLPVTGRKDLSQALSDNPERYILTLISLDANLDTVKDLLDALNVILFFLFGIFLLIVMTGIVNTYRVILFERTKEIGTMRALGTGRLQVLRLFLAEAFFLAVSAAVFGTLLGVLMLAVVTNVPLTTIPGAGLFTNNGFLVFFLKPSLLVIAFTIMVASVVLAVSGTARKASTIPPAEALREEV